jgi:hypothetical protein
MMGRQARASTVIMRRWEPHDPGGSCLHHTIGRYRALPHDRTDRENAGALPQTETYFAWTIHPPLTAAVLGAGYWASFVLELLSARERLWARTRVAVPAVLLFSTLTWPSPWSMPTASISTAGSSSPGLAPGGG